MFHDLSQAMEKLEQSFSIKINNIITELRSELTSINNTIKTELANLATATAEIKSEINELRSEYSGLRGNINDLNNKYRTLEEELSSIKDSYEYQCNDQADLKKRLDILNTHTITDLPVKVTDLQDKIDSMEQHARQNNIEIGNIPEKRGENLLAIIESIGNTIKCQLHQNNILSIHRVPHARKDENSRPKNIIVKLCSRILRDNVLSAFRITKGLKTDQLGLSGTPRNVYMNEHLTLRNKQLFRSSHEAAKKHLFKYVWIKNGTVLARMSDTSPILAIRCNKDLCKIGKTNSDNCNRNSA
ncbi:hypothetical protein ACJJTC_003992 [Scirpophaga incertulas]